MEQERRVVGPLQGDLAGELRIAQFGVALHVGIQGPAYAAPALGAGDNDPVDVEKPRKTIAEPGEVAAVVR